jgi:4-amino-4-deoxy-L-arabinose transferase-like glycosyltransferase
MKALLSTSRGWIGLLGLLCLLVFLIRISGPSDLEGYAQHRNVGYVMDAVWGGNWLAQYDIQGRILSKPPLHTWLAAGFAALLGVDRLALILPSFFAVLALTLLVFEVGRRRFGLLAGGLAGLAVVLAPMLSKHIALLRSDPLFALAIAAGAFAALRAWEQGRGWTVFWIAAAIATLTKGPLGLVLAAAGLLAWFWERRTDPGGNPPLRGPHWAGLALFLAIPLAWFLPAWWQYGQELIDKMFFDELLGHATGAGRDRSFGENLPRPTLFFLQRFLPFSLFAFYGIWRVFRRPATDAAERRFERFLVCWILAGLLIFSLAAHHRADLLLPLWPAAALLAGREMAALAQRIGARRFAVAAVLVGALLLSTVYVNYHASFGKREARTDYVADVRAAAQALRASGLDVGALHHIDTPVTLQMELGTLRRWLTAAERQALRATPPVEPLLVAVEDADLAALGVEGPAFAVEQVFAWAEAPDARPLIRVYRVSAAAQ